MWIMPKDCGHHRNLCHRASWVGTGYNFLETPDPKRKFLTQLPHNSNITALIQVSNDLIGQSGKPHYY